MAHEVLGRAEEFAAGRRFLAAAAAGPACFVIEGPPGIGKSLLWRALADEGATGGARLLVSRPSELETDLPHASLTDLLEPVSDEVRPRLPSAQRGALDAALLVADVDRDGTDLRALGMAVLTSLRALAAAGPLIVAIDDVHWADTATAGVLSFAARRLHTEPVGFLLARRPAPLPREVAALDAAFAPGWREVRQLGPLSLGGLHRLIDERLGINLPRPSLVHLERASHGVPLYALELVDALRRDGRPMTPETLVPAPIELGRMVMLRFEAMPPATRRLIEAVAAIGRPAMPLLAALEAADVAAALAPALADGLLERESDRVRFGHPLYRSAVYGALTADDRLRLHRRIAGVVPDPGTAALHLARGTDAVDPAVAVRVADEAAAADRRGTADTAVALYEHAVRLTPVDATDERVDRMLSLARLLWEQGDVERSRAITSELLHLAPTGASRALAGLLAGNHLLWTMGAAAAIETYREALAEASGDPELEATVHLRIAYVSDDDLVAAAEHATAAVSLVETRPGAEDLAACALLMLAEISLQLGGAYDAEKADRGRAFLRDHRSVRDVRSSFDARRVAAERSWLLRAATDDLPTARAEMEAMRRADEAVGFDRSAPIAFLDLAELCCQIGDATAARSYADLAAQFAGQTGNLPYAAAAAAFAGAIVAEHTGDDVSAARLASVARGVGAELGDGPMLARIGVLEARLAVGQRRPRRAADLLLEVAASTASSGLRHPAAYRFHGDLVEALVLAGSAEEAATRTAEFSTAVDRSPTPWGRAVAARSRGLVAAATGDLERAVLELDEAVRQHVGLPMPVEHGRTLIHLGRVHRRRRKKQAAGDAFDTARAVFAAAGATGWERVAATEAGRVGSRATTVDALTATEREVARLAAAGMTNRQVADAMVLSPKTVDGALTRVYAKLDIHTRAELGAWIATEDARTQG